MIEIFEKNLPVQSAENILHVLPSCTHIPTGIACVIAGFLAFMMILYIGPMILTYREYTYGEKQKLKKKYALQKFILQKEIEDQIEKELEQKKISIKTNE